MTGPQTGPITGPMSGPGSGPGARPDMIEAVAAQLRAELGPTARELGALLGVDLLTEIELRFEPAIARLAATLAGGDEAQAADAARTVAFLRWPEDGEIDPRWWRTPVGRLVARSVGHESAEAVTQDVAAAMLGVSRGTISQMIARGRSGLERHPDGGITQASVLALLARRDR